MTSFVPSSDLLLARRAAAGQADAWQEIVDGYGRRIYNLAYQFTRNSTEAEDLTQEVFLRLFRRLRTYRGEVPFAGWAMRLSRNLCIDHYRKARTRGQTVSDAVLEQLPAADDPAKEAEQSEVVRAVYRCLDLLPEELAEVLVLRDLQEWTGDETAAYLDVALGTVKSRLHRARKLFRGLLDERLGRDRADRAVEGRFA